MTEHDLHLIEIGEKAGAAKAQGIIEAQAAEIERLNKSAECLAESRRLAVKDVAELEAEIERLREALGDIACDDVGGVQGLIEDGVYEETETSRYYATCVSWRRKHARAALADVGLEIREKGQ